MIPRAAEYFTEPNFPSHRFHLLYKNTEATLTFKSHSLISKTCTNIQLFPQHKAP